MNFSAIDRRAPAGRLLRLPLKLLPGQAQMPILQGKLRGKRWIVGSGPHGYWLGSYELNKRVLFEKLVLPGATVFDVGAHVGFYTLLASALVGEAGLVVAFEPLPRNLAYVRKHLQLNGVRNVQVVDAAVAEEEGMARFAPGPDPSQGRLDSEGGMRVRTVALDAMRRRGDVPEPDVVKIDIEGGEAGALRGARTLLEERHPIVLVATHGPERHAECTRLLSELGYGIPEAGTHGLTHDELVAT